jgi:hypothetical protein
MLSAGGPRFLATPEGLLKRTLFLTSPSKHLAQVLIQQVRTVDCLPSEANGCAETQQISVADPSDSSACSPVEDGVRSRHGALPHCTSLHGAPVPAASLVLRKSTGHAWNLKDSFHDLGQHTDILSKRCHLYAVRLLSSISSGNAAGGNTSWGTVDPASKGPLLEPVVLSNALGEVVGVNQKLEAAIGRVSDTERPSPSTSSGDTRDDTQLGGREAHPQVSWKKLKKLLAVSTLANIQGHTFHKSVPQVVEAIKEADFVAFDLDLTGLASAPWREPMELDTRNTIYANVKHSAENFLVVQVGLCPFQWVAEAGHFKVSPFKFQIFPRLKPSWGYSVAPSFMCESASMKFLSLNQIDVTDAIDNGEPSGLLPYKWCISSCIAQEKGLTLVPLLGLSYMMLFTSRLLMQDEGTRR